MQELHAAHVGEIDLGALVPFQLFEPGKALALILEYRAYVDQLKSPDFLALVVNFTNRAGIDTEITARAIVRINLQHVAHFGEAARTDPGSFEACWSIFDVMFMAELGPDGCVWANEGAVAALDAVVFQPFGNGRGNAALFPPGGAGGVGAIHR